MRPTSAVVEKPLHETLFDVVTNLCTRFPALSPFDLLERPTRDVLDLYIDAVIQAHREGKNGGEEATETSERVYSWNATWH